MSFQAWDKRQTTEATISVANISEACDLKDEGSSLKLVQWWVESNFNSQYRYTETKSVQSTDSDKGADQPFLASMNFLIEEAYQQQDALERHIAMGRSIGEGQTLCRHLANLPGNICTPSYLAKTAVTLGKKYDMKTTVLDEAKMKKLGMNSLLSVSKGSREPAKLMTLEYTGTDLKQAPIVLIGKGLTFDAGGISIKPSAKMDEMKYDMCGGASVLGVMRALGELGLPVNVVGIVVSSENLPDGAANKPGDVVTSMLGKTIEILNTDAEGRLILCDALTYAERFKPAVVIRYRDLNGRLRCGIRGTRQWPF